MNSSQCCLAQIDSTQLFEKSKGKWSLPLPKYLKIFDNQILKRSTANMFDSTLRIITDSAYQVKAVYEGRIIAIIEVEHEYSIVTKFGDYFLAYSNLTKPNLKQGELVRTGQTLGRLVKHRAERTYTLEIILSKGEEQLSAEKWIDWKAAYKMNCVKTKEKT